MKRLATGLLAVLLCITGFVPVVHAGKKKVLSQQTYKVLMTARDYLGTGKAAKAIADLEQLLTGLQEKPYEHAVVLQGLSHAHISREDYVSAIPLLRRCIELGVLPDEPQQRARYNLAKLYIATEAFTEAINVLEIWFTREEKPRAEAFVILATAHMQQGHYQKAVEPLREAIRISVEPRENWYQSLLGAHSELKQYGRCATLLHAMLKRFPGNPSYWRQLVGIQLMRNRYRDALAAMELAHLRGHIKTEREFLNFAQLYLHQNAPYKAAALMEDEIRRGRIKKTGRNWEHIANAWLLARERNRSIVALENAKAGLGNSTLGLRLAQLYIGSRRWMEAGRTLESIIKAGELDAEATGQAWMLLGIVRHETQSTREARAAFVQARKYRKTAGGAEQWLTFLEQT